MATRQLAVLSKSSSIPAAAPDALRSLLAVLSLTLPLESVLLYADVPEVDA